MNANFPATGKRDADLAFPRAVGGFSLVEVTIAIGIFTFVIVAILGLFPVALRQRSDAATETRAVLIAQQVFGGIQANSLTNALCSDYSIKWDASKNPSLQNLTNGLVLGFSDKGTTVNHIFSGTSAWDSTDVGPPAQSITTKAFVSTTNVAPGLYAVSVRVGYPAYLPADKRRVQNFSPLISSP